MLNIKEKGQVSGGIIELIVKNIAEVSYRVCAEMINNMTGLSISGVAVWNIVQQLGEEIKQYEKEKVEAFQEDKLKAGEKETPTVYQEADGIMIYTQGKDRKEQIENYKKEHPNEEVPKKVRNIEIKLGMTYEGWKEIGKNRYALVGKEFPYEFDRNLVSLIQQKDFDKVKGIIIGRTQTQAGMNLSKWKKILNKKELKNIPIIINANFGHTTPNATIPIGGNCKINTYEENKIFIQS